MPWADVEEDVVGEGVAVGVDSPLVDDEPERVPPEDVADELTEDVGNAEELQVAVA